MKVHRSVIIRIQKIKTKISNIMRMERIKKIYYPSNKFRKKMMIFSVLEKHFGIIRMEFRMQQ